MFWNSFSKRIIISLRDKELVIWTLLFPLFLGTLFFFAFSSLDSADKREPVKLAVIENDAYRQDTTLQTVLHTVSKEGTDQLFEQKIVSSVREADDLLKSGDIDCYILVEDLPTLYTAQNGLNQSIAKAFLDQYLQTQSAIKRILMESPEKAGELTSLLGGISYSEEISLTDNPVSQKVTYFYSLLAMTAMYGAFHGLNLVSCLQANLSAVGARRSIAPVKHFKQLMADLMACQVIHTASLFIVILYIEFVLKISFGSRLPLVFLTAFLSALMGISFGMAISTLTKFTLTVKSAILVAGSMICSYLSGLMNSNTAYTVKQKAPIVAWLNPAARVSDSFYSLYYYDDYKQYLLCTAALLAMILLFFGITAVHTRREQYESI